MRADGTLLFALAVLMAPSAVHAAPLLSGSFSTTASNGSFRTQAGNVALTGTSINGTFALKSAPSAQSPRFVKFFGPGAYLTSPGLIVLAFDVAAISQTVTFGTAGTGIEGFLQLADNGLMQSVLLVPAYNNPHENISLSLRGPEGSLFDGVTDPASLHTGAGVTVASPISFGVFLEGGATLTVTGQSIPVTTPVDEPSAWSIAAIALIGMLVIKRNRRFA